LRGGFLDQKPRKEKVSLIGKEEARKGAEKEGNSGSFVIVKGILNGIEEEYRLDFVRIQGNERSNVVPMEETCIMHVDEEKKN